jgi:hypothetical protein
VARSFGSEFCSEINTAGDACLGCKQNYLYDENSMTCGEDFALAGKTQDAECKVVDGEGDCVVCHSDSIFDPNGDCVANSTPGLQFCLKKDGAENCVICIDGYLFKGDADPATEYSCVPNDGLPNCLIQQHDDDGVCITCQEDFLFDQNAECFPKSQAKFYVEHCEEGFKSTVNLQTEYQTCTTCAEGYILSENSQQCVDETAFPDCEFTEFLSDSCYTCTGEDIYLLYNSGDSKYVCEGFADKFAFDYCGLFLTTQDQLTIFNQQSEEPVCLQCMQETASWG